MEGRDLAVAFCADGGKRLVNRGPGTVPGLWSRGIDVVVRQAFRQVGVYAAKCQRIVDRPSAPERSFGLPF